MAWPRSADYFEAIQNPQLCFDDVELRQGQPALDHLGMPRLCSGNFADVYQLCGPNQHAWAVKCFTRERQAAALQQRYQSIGVHLQQVRLPFMVEFRFLEQGIRIRGTWYPILKMRWVEGSTLETFVKAHLDKPRTLKALAELWVRLARSLRQSDITHADLQHGNVLLIARDQGEKVSLRLIDYDGMWLPALAQSASGEEGHPNYQHPQRTREHVYSAAVDRFSHLVIYCALRCLAAEGRPLWDRFGDDDRMLFGKKDFETPGKSAVFQELWANSGPAERALVGQLILAGQGPLERVPLLEELADNGHAPELTAAQEKQIQTLLQANGREVRKGPPPLPPRNPAAYAPSDTAWPQTFLGIRPFSAKPSRLRSALPLAGLILVLGLTLGILFSMSSPERKQALAIKASNKVDKVPPSTPFDKDKGTVDRDKEGDLPKGPGPGKGGTSDNSDTRPTQPDVLVKPKVDPPDEARKRPTPPSRGERSRVGVYEAPRAGTSPVLLQKRNDGWKRLVPNDTVFTVEPLVCLPGYTSEVRLNSNVLLTLRGNLPEFSIHTLMTYLLDSAIILHQTTEFDADLTLLRGRIYITSTNPVEQGETKVRVRFSGEVWDLALTDPATEIGIDLLRQYTSDINWRTGEEPRTEAYLCVLKGKAQLTQNLDRVHKLAALPREAAFLWDNSEGARATPKEVKEVPPIWYKDLPVTAWKKHQRELQDSVAKMTPEKQREIQAYLNNLGQGIVAADKMLAAMKELSTEMTETKSVNVVLLEGTGVAQQPQMRELAIVSLAAIDEVGKLFDVLANKTPSANPDRDNAIFALRNWISRSADQGKLLYDGKEKTGLLRNGQRFNAVEAETILALLHDFSPKDSRSKETFEYLVGSLRKSKLAIRQLAYWHLLRLSQGLKEFSPYDPVAPEEVREMMVQKWEQLVEAGQLPPRQAEPK